MSAFYNTILYTREAQYLDVPETPTESPTKYNIDGIEYPVYRDQNGYYVIVNTKNGTQRANEGQWLVLMTQGTPGVPATNEVKAVGSFTISNDATGDGKVGFSYNGVNFSFNPTAGMTAQNTAANLSGIVNSNAQLQSIVIGDTLTLVSKLGGASGNLPLADISEDTTQSCTLTGMSGGVDYDPGVPSTPNIFKIYNDGDFQLVYEPSV